MSLFNETVRRVSELESELAEAHDRIRNLEVALKSARVDKMRAVGARGYFSSPAEALSAKQKNHDLNTLSDDEVNRLFELHENDAWMVESVDTADLKSAANSGMLVRSRLWAPVLKMCALLKRQ